MANIIKIKRSTTTATPTSLSEGELAYSEDSGNLFIGTAGSNLEKIGGNTDAVKLAGIESGATADQTAAEILTAIKTVDGSGSGLDADKLDNLGSSQFLRSDIADNFSGKLTWNGTAAATSLSIQKMQLANLEKGNLGGDGELGFDASQGLLISRSQQGTTGVVSVLDGANVDAGTNIAITNLGTGDDGTTPFTFSVVQGTGSGLDADKLDGNEASAFALAHSHPYLSSTHDASGVTATKISNWDSAAAWHLLQVGTTDDGNSVIDTVADIVSAFENHAEGLNLITELDAKLTASSTIDGGTF